MLIDANEIQARLRTRRVGRRVLAFDELDSTNRWLLDRPVEERIDGVVVLAERQTAGRGRQGRNWECPKGAGLLFSIGHEGRLTDGELRLLPLLTPLAVCDALDAVSEVRAEIKWPNDIVVGGRKLAGILIETRATGDRARSAIGIGLNCLQHAAHFPPELREQATSLEILSHGPVDRAAVLGAVLEAFDCRMMSQKSPAETCAAWRRRAIGLGGRVRLCQDGRFYDGNLLDIDPTAAILVQLDEGGRRLFDAAHTHIVELRP